MTEYTQKKMSMRDWGLRTAEEVRKKSDPKLADLAEDFTAARTVGWKLMEEMDLPHSRDKHKMPLTEFLPQLEHILSLDAKHLWFVLLEDHKGEHRYRKPELSSAEAREFVKTTIAEHELNPEEYDILFSDNHKQIYGGNIMIGHDGAVYIEFIHGNQGIIADGSYSPAKHGEFFKVTRDPGYNSFKYSWEDGEATDNVPLRQLIYRTLMCIPHEGEGREMKFTAGYYEFSLVEKDPTKGLEPLFLDCRTDASFTAPPSGYPEVS